MTLPIFPSSPVWADTTRAFNWSEEVFRYDSGVRQGSTPWSRPLYKYSINAKNYNEIKQSSLQSFYNGLFGRTSPFLIKDPYEFEAEAITQPTSTNMNSGDGFFFINENGWRTIPDSADLYMEDPRSGQLLPSSHFVMSQDNGFCALLVAVSSIWTSSFTYFRKAAFESPMQENSPSWNQFNTTLVIEELIPDR